MIFGHYASITPSDTVAFADGECDSIFVGGPGVIVVVRPDGTAVQFTTTVNHVVLPVKAIRVNATNTTATAMTALYRHKGFK